MAYAHTPNESGQSHDLVDHLPSVAELAAEFAAPFGASDLARCLGLWHDLGSFTPEFQAYLRAQVEHTPPTTGLHAIWGVAPACEMLWKRNKIDRSVLPYGSGIRLCRGATPGRLPRERRAQSRVWGARRGGADDLSYLRLRPRLRGDALGQGGSGLARIRPDGAASPGGGWTRARGLGQFDVQAGGLHARKGWLGTAASRARASCRGVVLAGQREHKGGGSRTAEQVAGR